MRRSLAVTLLVGFIGGCWVAGYATWAVTPPVGGVTAQFAAQVLVLVLAWYGGGYVGDLTRRLWFDGDDAGDR